MFFLACIVLTRRFSLEFPSHLLLNRFLGCEYARNPFNLRVVSKHNERVEHQLTKQSRLHPFVSRESVLVHIARPERHFSGAVVT